MSKYRIAKRTYSSGDVRYQIQQKILWWWFDLASEYWQGLSFAEDRVKSFEGNKVISQEIVK